MSFRLTPLADLHQFDEIIDVRSPAEFAEDHIPGAINCPVLDDQQRIEVGTIYKQVSPFEANKIGAALISENIARHLRERFLSKPKQWRPLIYCWRGGNRSGAMTTIFRAIGWPAGQLENGYKAWRSHVINALATTANFKFMVISGPTGSAKTHVLQALRDLGEQVLDLENLACHKGSVLGVLPKQAQPAQKWFETCIQQAIATYDPSRPIFVEAESRKIGRLHLPEPLMNAMHAGQCLNIAASNSARLAFLLEDYAYFLHDPDFLRQRLNSLQGLHSKETMHRWHSYIDQAAWPALVKELLDLHYDPHYHRSHKQHFAKAEASLIFTSDDLSTVGIRHLAHAIHARTAQIA